MFFVRSADRDPKRLAVKRSVTALGGSIGNFGWENVVPNENLPSLECFFAQFSIEFSAITQRIMSGNNAEIKPLVNFLTAYKNLFTLNKFMCDNDGLVLAPQALKTEQHGNTLLHFATASGNADLANCLLFHFGADPVAKNNEGLTPDDYYCPDDRAEHGTSPGGRI